MTKKFRLTKEQITPIATGFGGCMATDRIVVDGSTVGFMYREKPINPQDCGWRFFAGDEDKAYMNDGSKHGVYDVNTIANYDPEIVPHLNAPIGSEFERDHDGELVKIK